MAKKTTKALFSGLKVEETAPKAEPVKEEDVVVEETVEEVAEPAVEEQPVEEEPAKVSEPKPAAKPKRAPAKPAKEEKKPAEKEQSYEYVRHTFYVTEEIVEAIKELAYRESRTRKKGTPQTFQSDIVREVFEAGLEARCPGIMKEMEALVKKRNK